MSSESLGIDVNASNFHHGFLDYALRHGFGEIHCKIDEATGMQAIIAIHNTKLGPALGGCRFISYPNSAMALYDAMRLARGMSYKSALANLPLGGGKSVIILPKGPFDRTAYFQRFGEFVESLQGRYITALDSGTELSDMDIIAQRTSYVASLSSFDGDPSPYTTRGVFRGIEAAVQVKLNKSSLNGLHVAIQGLGHVGLGLARMLHEQGARLTVTDVNLERAKQVALELGATVVDPESIHKVPCDVFAPCALGAVINDTSINELQTTIVAGAANNQLEHTYHGQQLYDRGILYAPDYVINAGGVIFAASSYFRTSDVEMNNKIDQIRHTLVEIFERSYQDKRPTSDIADKIALERLS